MAWVDLENFTGNVKRIFNNEGQEFVILPYSAKAFPEETANQFLRDCSGFVRKASQTNVPPLLPGEKAMWVANMTGSPFVDVQFKNKVAKRTKTAAGIVSEEVEEVIPNPVSKEQILKWSMSTGQGPDPYGRLKVRGISAGDDFNLPPLQISIRPRTRIVVSENIALWMIQRDSMEAPYGNGKVAECREPTEFEPTMQWPLDQIVFFARMVDDVGFNGKVVDQMIVDSGYGKTRGKALSLAMIMSSARHNEFVKDAMLQRLFYRIVDKRFNLPTQQAFTAAYEIYTKGPTDEQQESSAAA